MIWRLIRCAIAKATCVTDAFVESRNLNCKRKKGFMIPSSNGGMCDKPDTPPSYGPSVTADIRLLQRFVAPHRRPLVDASRDLSAPHVWAVLWFQRARCAVELTRTVADRCDNHVPSDHLLRGIDRFLDLTELRRHVVSFYSHAGSPALK